MTMKRFLLHIIYITALLPFLGSCSQSEDTPTDTSGNDHVQLSLSVTARALPQEGMEIGTGTPENMHLWVFGSVNDAQNTNGYDQLAYRVINSPSFAGSDAFGNPVHTITDLDIPEGKKYTKMYFYVVLNSGSVTGLGDLNKDTKISLNKDTKISDLQALTFSGINQGKEDNEMLMYGMSELEINPHKTNYETGIEVTRAVAKLELYFTKEWESSNLLIRDISISSKVNKGYLVPVENWGEKDIYGETLNSSSLFSNTEGLSISKSSEEEYGNFSEDLSNFQKVELINPYLMENPNGKGWDEDTYVDSAYPTEEGQADEDKYYQITVDYVIDGLEKSQSFYLPVIQRNYLYRILIRVSGEHLVLKLQVNPWNKVEEIWSYEETLAVETSGQIEWQNIRTQSGNVVVVNNIGSSATTSCTFRIKSPEEATWTAVLRPEQGTQDAFEFVSDGGTSIGVSTSGNVKDGTATLRIRPTDVVYAPNFNTARLLVYINYMGRTQVVENLMPIGIEGKYFIIRQDPN